MRSASHTDGDPSDHHADSASVEVLLCCGKLSDSDFWSAALAAASVRATIELDFEGTIRFAEVVATFFVPEPQNKSMLALDQAMID